MKKVFLSFLSIAILLCGYIFALKKWSASYLADVIPTALALVAAVTFWIEYSHNSNINEAKFILELNNQFISNPDLKKVEWVLENYYAKYGPADEREILDNSLREQFALEKEDRQNLVNYLVHLEGIATLVCSHQLRLNQISNLMAYRYFIAVNNPIVQELELLPPLYSDHYKGISEIYCKWEWHLRLLNITIPMEKEAINSKRNKEKCVFLQGCRKIQLAIAALIVKVRG